MPYSYLRSGFPRSEATGIEKRAPSMPAPPQPPFRYDFFVSPTGSGSNLGTFESPWTLAYARGGANGLIVPGVHVGVRAGQYFDSSPKTFTIAGLKSTGYADQAGKIIWRNYNIEHAEWACDSVTKGISSMEIAAGFNWFWGIDGWRKHTDRFNYPGPGTVWWIQNASLDGTRLIHCHGHEGSNGFFSDSNIGNVVLYGCVSYHAGTSTDPRAHGFYLHHTRDSGSVGSRLLVSDHISFDHLGNCGQIFASGSPDQLDDIDILWMITWGGGKIASTTTQVNLTFGGTDSADIPLRGFTARNIISRNPFGYGSANLRFYGGGTHTILQDAILEDAYLVGGTSGSGNGRLSIDAMHWSSFQARRNTMINLEQTFLIRSDDTVYTPYTAWEDNAFYGSDPTALKWRSGPGFTDRTWTGWKTFTGLGNAGGHLDTAQTTLPTATKVFVRPVNTYEYGRGHVVYFNYAGLARVPVDLSSFLAPGDNIVVRNAQDYWGPTLQVYDAPTGGNVVSTWTGVPVYFPTDGVTPPPPFGFNNAALNAWTYPSGNAKSAPDFDTFIVSIV